MKTRFRLPTIPQYVRDLNDLAAVHGITTATAFARDNDGRLRLWAQWRGTWKALQAIGLLARHQIARLRGSRQRLPNVRRLMLTVPSSEPPWCNPLLRGEIEVLGNHFEWTLDFGPGDFSIANRGDVEAITYSDEICLYGTPEALIRAQIDEERLPLGRRTAKSSRRDSRRWHSRRLRNGLVLYRFRTYANGPSAQVPAHWPPTACTSSHLRLVVDNTLHAAPTPLITTGPATTYRPAGVKPYSPPVGSECAARAHATHRPRPEGAAGGLAPTDRHDSHR